MTIKKKTCFSQNVKYDFQAFSRFSEDISAEDDDHLDLPLLQEREILAEYKRYLEM